MVILPSLWDIFCRLSLAARERSTSHHDSHATKGIYAIGDCLTDYCSAACQPLHKDGFGLPLLVPPFPSSPLDPLTSCSISLSLFATLPLIPKESEPTKDGRHTEANVRNAPFTSPLERCIKACDERSNGFEVISVTDNPFPILTLRYNPCERANHVLRLPLPDDQPLTLLHTAQHPSHPS